MSASEQTCLHVWRAANGIMIVAIATISTVGANHDIMSASEPTCLHVYTFLGRTLMIRFLPDEYYSSTYRIDFKKYYDMGYRGILFDIDNTLVRHNEPATSRAIQLMEQLKAIGFKVCLVSNNKEPRVAAFNKKMKVNYIYKAGKPSKKGYIRAMNEIGCTIDDTIAVGDQIYTDIIGSASLGIHTILVKPIDTSHEEIQITLKRIIEKPFIFYFRKKHGMVK